MSTEEPAEAPEPASLACGMKLAVVHRTVFYYGSPVIDSVNTLHLEPRTFPFQQTLGALVKVLPATRVRRFTDLFQNITHHFELPQPHAKLEIESRIKVRNLPLEISSDAKVSTLDDCKDCSIRERIWPFLQESHLISKTPDVWRQAVDLTRGHVSVYEQALAILHWIHATFSYESGSTHVHTHMEEAFELRRGVCQDYTHVMIGLCRAVGIGARYASGYLYNGPRDRLVGAQASHAWCEVYLPGAGWIGFDPTNGTLADARYVKIAVGRDYDDVAPVKGSYHGHGHCHMEVTVEVSRIES
ncbi:transglutaminase family protein [Luteolibacter sp. LG18]|uniref:transglutaminase family protein n=1 Tax=Luteolibacter sp. LG18 TaxID=2819286 RepID=UPI0030C70842